MADGDIKQRIVLTGEKEYSAALKEAQRNLKTLRSELKAETAELGANATAQQKNEVKVKNLQKQIKEQEKVVRTYKAALDEVKEKYGDNQDAIAKWEQKLNDARATLANMKNGLQDVGNGMQSIEGNMERGVVAANSFADSLGKIAGVGDTISGAIESSFTTIVGHITDAVSALWDQLMDVAARANEWSDIAGYWNTSASNIQKWYHAVEGTYNEFSSLSSAVTKIVTADQKKVAEVAGVSAEQYSDKWEYAMAVMDSLSKMGYEKKLEAVGELFGDKRSPIILDLLNDWDKIRKNLDDFDATNGGFGLTDEQLEKASTLAEDVAKLKESWEALKAMTSIELFGDLALNITGNLQNIVEAFKEYFQAENDEQKQAALQKVKDNIIEIFKNIRDAITEGLKLLDDLAEELKNSPDATARALGEALDKIVGALEWVANPENWDAVKRGFEALIGIWAVGKVTSAVGNLASFAANVLTIKNGGRWLFNGGSAIANAAINTGTAITSAEITAAITASAGPIAAAIAGLTMSVGVVTMAVPVIAALSDIVAGKWPDWLPDIRKSPVESAYAGKSSEEVAALEDTYNQITSNKPWGLKSGKEIFSWASGNRPAEKTEEEKIQEIIDALPQAFVNAGAYVPSPTGSRTKIDITPEQRAAAEAYWDIVKSDQTTDEEWDAAEEALTQAFEGNEKALSNLQYWLDKLWWAMDENRDSDSYNPSAWEDLPASWWTNNDNGLTSEDISGFRSVPGQMRAAVREGISGIRVTMDGAVVGNLVAPYVSQYIARDIVG